MNTVIESTSIDSTNIEAINVEEIVFESATTSTVMDVTTLSATLKTAARNENKSDFDKALNGIIAERVSWEQNEFDRSNKKLYAILKTCYAMFQTMNSTDAEAKAYKLAFNEFCERNHFNFKGSTHLTAKIVHCVFGDDRRRVSNYGTALRIAAEKKVTHSDFISFIETCGGVEEVRRDKKAGKSPKDRAKAGKASLHGEVLGSVSSELLNSKFDASAYTDAVLLLATKEDDGSFAIRRVIQNSTVITAALASLAKDVQKEAEKTVVEDTAVNDMQQRSHAIELAIAA